MKTDSKILRFFVGVFTLFIIVFFYGVFRIFTGPHILGHPLWNLTKTLQSFWYFVGLSIICTAGISLIIWIPALLILGTVVVKMVTYKNIYKKSPNVAGLSEDADLPDVPSNEELAIIQYIISCRNIGEGDDIMIRSALKNAGWTADDIDGAFDKCAPGN